MQFNTAELTHPPPLLNKDTVYFPALLESRTRKPPSLFWETTHTHLFKLKSEVQLKHIKAVLCISVYVNTFTSVFNRCSAWLRFIFLEYQL